MQISMTDLDVLQNFEYIVCTGSLRGPYQLNRPNHKPYWAWMTMVAPAIVTVWDSFRPFMSERRRIQGDTALAARYKYENDSVHFNRKLNVFPDYIIERASMLDHLDLPK